MELYKREDYLKKIRGFYRDTGIIKVITGVRRSGKSCLMLTIMDELRETGVDDDNIIYLNLDSRVYISLKEPSQLEKAIEKEAQGKAGMKFLFIDEIQNVKDFEPLLNAYREEGYSIFITGSNSYLLSGELSTKLTGRYIEFELFPLSFFEYVDMKRFLGKIVAIAPMQEFQEYITNGGFPKSLAYDAAADRSRYVQGIIHEILDKDVRKRKQVRSASVFERVLDFILNNFGNTMSISKIHAFFVNEEHLVIKRETIVSYIQLLEDAKIIYRCPRFDIKSRKALRGEQKYYLADLSFYFARNTDNRINYGPVLENIVYIYARSLDYEISVGRIGKLECDFILRSPERDYAYLQIAMSIASKETEDREYAALENIRDAYPKYLLTLDPLTQKRNGVKHKNLVSLLLAKERFL